MEIMFDFLSDLDLDDSFSECKFKVTPPEVPNIEYMELPLRLDLDFINAGNIHCRTLKIRDGAVIKFCNMQYFGSIVAKNAKLEFDYCDFFSLQGNTNQVLFDFDDCEVIFRNCIFNSGFKNIIECYNDTTIEASECQFFGTFESMVKMRSKCYLMTKNSFFLGQCSSCFYLETSCELCSELCKYNYGKNVCSLKHSKCSFKNDEISEFDNLAELNGSMCSISSCLVLHLRKSALMMDKSDAEIIKTQFEYFSLNGIVQLAFSSITIFDSIFRCIEFPCITSFNQSMVFIFNTSFIDCNNGAIILKSDSSGYISNSTFKNTNESFIRMADSQNTIISKCKFIGKCESSVTLCDFADVLIKKCCFLNDNGIGIDVFCGAKSTSKNIEFKGGYSTEINIHHAGSFIGDTINIASSNNDNIESHIVCQTKRDFILSNICLNDKKIHDIKEHYKSRVIKSKNNKLCCSCDQEFSTLRLFPCGHSVSFQTKDKSKCSLCRSMVQAHQCFFNAFCCPNNKKCIICETNEYDCLIVPCGHPICKKCWRISRRLYHYCPTCRKSNVQMIRIVPYE